jgi:hydrogenase expression/formation protein HypD
MKFVDEFRDGGLARTIARNIEVAARPERSYNLMEFCGGHTHTISRYGLADLLPPGVRMIHGPGCPVCVLPIGRIDSAIELAGRPGMILCTYADTMRVPASQGASLLKAKARGLDIRMVYSAADALRIAVANPGREVVFFAIGFETTTPPTALVLREAARLGLRNFSVFCNHVVTPAAIASILDSPQVRELGAVPIDGFIGPAHVSCVIGSRRYEHFAQEYHKPVVIAGFEPLDVMQAVLMLVRQLNEDRKPVVIAGFEPLDVMQAVLMLVRQLNEDRAEVENEFSRAVTRYGNPTAQELVAEVFELRRTFEWRGLGEVPYSALRIKAQYADFDAEQRYGVDYRPVADNKACECGAILRGVKQPRDCKLFGTVCTPENPMGSCMVSSEGACAAHYSYGRFRDRGQPQATEGTENIA